MGGEDETPSIDLVSVNLSAWSSCFPRMNFATGRKTGLEVSALQANTSFIQGWSQFIPRCFCLV